MIYFRDTTLFVHIPRTSGVSLTTTVMRHLSDPEHAAPSIVLGDVGKFRRHSAAHRLFRIMDEFAAIPNKFTIVRNPWRICESMYKHFLRKHAILARGDNREIKLRGRLSAVADQSFPQFVCQHFQFLRNGGFFAHWCCEWGTGLDLYGVEAFRFEELGEASNWQRICSYVHLPVNTKREVINSSGDGSCEWDDQSVEFIRERCVFDFERFGYPDHP